MGVGRVQRCDQDSLENLLQFLQEPDMATRIRGNPYCTVVVEMQDGVPVLGTVQMKVKPRRTARR